MAGSFDCYNSSWGKMTKLKIYSGDVWDGFQAVYGSNNYSGGGTGGGEHVIDLSSNSITEITGQCGVWYGWNSIAKVKIKTSDGKSHGPFGTLSSGNWSQVTNFEFKLGSGDSLDGFFGKSINVPLAGGSRTDIINEIGIYRNGDKFGPASV